MALIDSYRPSVKNIPTRDKIRIIVETSNDMMTGRIKPGGKGMHAGPLGMHAPISYPATFFILFLMIQVVGVFISNAVHH